MFTVSRTARLASAVRVAAALQRQSTLRTDSPTYYRALTLAGTEHLPRLPQSSYHPQVRTNSPTYYRALTLAGTEHTPMGLPLYSLRGAAHPALADSESSPPTPTPFPPAAPHRPMLTGEAAEQLWASTRIQSRYALPGQHTVTTPVGFMVTTLPQYLPVASLQMPPGGQWLNDRSPPILLSPAPFEASPVLLTSAS
ncbi:hypothetical protein C8Q76DRAFT_690237 [Earliella scabrosa]|nr:hypothetical protein C8Q76DRAFT_690237 [Earliella scabrosa]